MHGVTITPPKVSQLPHVPCNLV